MGRDDGILYSVCNVKLYNDNFMRDRQKNNIVQRNVDSVLEHIQELF